MGNTSKRASSAGGNTAAKAAKAARNTKTTKAKTVDDGIFEDLAIHQPNAAGIDIGSQEHYVSVPEERDTKPVRTFGCTTPQLREMAVWLKQCGIRSVIMESTGVYWVPVYQVLEDAGFEVYLVDAHHAKNVPGRKSDVWDFRWIRKLHTYGLLRGCFIPPADVLELRTYLRHRATLVETCSQQVLGMQKALEQMNLQFHKALSDITGISGMKILRAIVAGERDPRSLAALCHKSVKASEDALISALTGHYRQEHLFVLAQALRTHDFLHAQMRECDQQIEQALSRFRQMEPPGPAEPPGGTLEPVEPVRSISRRKNEPHFDLRPDLRRAFGVDLLKIDGISALTAMTLLSEYGPDLSRFSTVRRFTSSLNLCPNNRITGGKVKTRRTRRGKNRTATALCLAAQSLHRSKSALGAYFRRMKSRLGAPKAITATAHKLARLVYFMLTRGEQYVDQGQAAYEQQYAERRLQSLVKHARSLGFSLVQETTGEVVS